MHRLSKHIVVVSLIASYLGAMCAVTIADSWKLALTDGQTSFRMQRPSKTVDHRTRIFQRRHLRLAKPFSLPCLPVSFAHGPAAISYLGPSISSLTEALLQVDLLRLVTARPPPAA
jgi:hypothetical protein